MKTKELHFFKQELERLRKELIESPRTETGEATKGDSCDIAATDRERELGLSLRERNRNKLLMIDEALERVEDGTYGICEDCGEDIVPGRLKIRPFATRCVHCKSKQEQRGRMSIADGGLLAEEIDVNEFREDRE